MRFTKLLFLLILLLSINSYAQYDTTNYSLHSGRKTVIIPLYYHSVNGYMLYSYPCFDLMSYNNNDSLNVLGSNTIGDSTGIDISLRKFSVDSVVTGGYIYFNGLTAGKYYQYMPYIPALKFLILKANTTISDTIYVKTLFQKQ